jgi:hypothetical protein
VYQPFNSVRDSKNRLFSFFILFCLTLFDVSYMLCLMFIWYRKTNFIAGVGTTSNRNSAQLVEAGFDGDLQELKNQLEKGYHLESVDGRKHTALSEAACQGHVEVMKYLLEIGADPNSVSDTGRSPLWRAAFNGHTEVQYCFRIVLILVDLCFCSTRVIKKTFLN